MVLKHDRFKNKEKVRMNSMYFCNKKLPEPSQIQTFCIELHEAIKRTNSNLFRQILSLKEYIYPNA